MKMSKKVVEIETRFEALHCWPYAPDQVSFLRNSHRHDFIVKVRAVSPLDQAKLDDRELEFFILKAKVDGIIREKIPKSSSFSCEKFASIIASTLAESLKGVSELAVMVYEDGKYGGGVILKEE